MRFHDPWWLLSLMLLLPLLWWIIRKPQVTARYPSLTLFQAAPRTLRVRLARTPAFLKWVAMFCLLVAMARPQQGNERQPVIREGIAIMMVLDRSSSMTEQDFVVGDLIWDRFSAAKQAFHDFVMGTEQSQGRSNDLVGMLSFARWADVNLPLTLDHQMIIDQLDRTRPARGQSMEDGTAIGEAVAAACQKLKQSSEFPTEPRAKVMVLLTDGAETVSTRDEEAINPMEAMQLAQSLGIKIYTIGVAPDPRRSQRFPQFFGVRSGVDEALLRTLAEETGGQYFRARDMEALQNTMAAINQLEKVRLEDKRFTEYDEKYAFLVFIAMACLLLAVFLGGTWLRPGVA